MRPAEPFSASHPRCIYPVFGEAFDRHLAESTFTIGAVADQLGISREVVRGYRRGFGRPSLANKLKLDAMFGTTFDISEQRPVMTVTAEELMLNFGHYFEIASNRPVHVVRNGDDDVMIVPFAEYQRSVRSIAGSNPTAADAVEALRMIDAGPPIDHGDTMPDYVAEFLRAVRANPGGKNLVTSYYMTAAETAIDGGRRFVEDQNLPEPSYKISERKGWVTCVGSHKWELTPAGLAAIGAEDAREFGQQGGDDNER